MSVSHNLEKANNTTFNWEQGQLLPKYLKTEKQLDEMGLVTPRKLAAFLKQATGETIALYDSRKAKSKLDVLKNKIRNDRIWASKWARKLLSRNDWVVLDTETTGDNFALDEIVQIAIISPDGNSLLNTLVKPTISIPTKAVNFHGITDETVAFAPLFSEVYLQIQKIIEGKQVIIYGKFFDTKFLDHCCKIYQLPSLWIKVEGNKISNAICLMHWYSQWCGEWNGSDPKRGAYKWQPLGGRHSALEDCQQVLHLLRKMAENN